MGVKGKRDDATPLSRVHVPSIYKSQRDITSATQSRLTCMSWGDSDTQIRNHIVLTPKMAPPSYARATASSTLKASPTLPSPGASKILQTLPPTPKKLKRPSTLTNLVRQSITYKADLYPINPQDPKKPCPLANLPSEIRTSIYQYILGPHAAFPLPQFVIKLNGQIKYIWPKLLHICRAMRIEAAYTYYTNTPFTFTVRNFDFSRLRSWLDDLPTRHRSLLSLNQHLVIHIVPGLRYTYVYPPPDWLLDSCMSSHWRDCSGFGNIYTIASPLHRVRFVLFCRILGWFQMNRSRNMKWRYVFDNGPQTMLWDKRTTADMFMVFLMDEVAVLRMGCVKRSWTRRRDGRGRDEGNAFLRALDEAFGMLEGGAKDALVESWAREMGKIRQAVEMW
jgi:hypothetical protein